MASPKYNMGNARARNGNLPGGNRGAALGVQMRQGLESPGDSLERQMAEQSMS